MKLYKIKTFDIHDMPKQAQEAVKEISFGVPNGAPIKHIVFEETNEDWDENETPYIWIKENRSPTMEEFDRYREIKGLSVMEAFEEIEFTDNNQILDEWLVKNGANPHEEILIEREW